MSAPSARACNTPVYRYAMYNWAPAPFFVFYFHHAETPAEDEKVNTLITELAEGGPALANVLIEPVDVSAGELERLPKPVKDAWQSYVADKAENAEPNSAEPAHIVFTSWGAKLHAGRLDEATVRALVDSPMRTKVGELLAEGCAAVMVFLPGSNAEENEQAEKTARDVIAQAAAGKIQVESGYLDATFAQWVPPAQGAEDQDAAETLSEEERIAAASRLKVGFVKLDRSDEAEKWVVRSLMAMEDDLEELTEHPMVFFAYGRGRAMPPYVGKGINAENLTAEIQFLASACSCLVKDQNPGADLLMHWNWEATADAMAAKDPTMSGGPLAYEEFYADAPRDTDASTEPGAMTEVASAVAGSPSGPDEAASANPGATDTEATGAEGSEEAASGPSASQPTSRNAGAVTVAISQPDQGTSFANRQMWTLGIGLVVVAVIVLGAGSVLIVKRATLGGHPVP